jgi:hypothetical protein
LNAGADQIDPAYDFMARNDRKLRIRELTVHNMQIRPAHAAG